jgi:hypothetical protein
MHLLIAHASGGGDAARAALAGLQAADWPHLARLLAGAPLTHDDGGDELSASPPHERALARLRGWQGGDGCWPVAAHRAALDGLDTGDAAVALLTPAHWHLGTEQVSMLDPALLALGPDESRALFEAVATLFDAAAGWRLAWGAPLRWYAMHPALQGLRSAALERVVGRNVDLWLSDEPAARPLRRLQVEAQMLLHTHPVNQAREARGALPVNSFWWSGCGPRQAEAPAAAAVQVHEALAAPLLAGDGAAWQAAWRALDAGALREALAAREAGTPVQITLCGERHARTWTATPRGWWARLAGRGALADIPALLSDL